MDSNSKSSDMLTAYLFARNFIVLLFGSAKCVELMWESEQVAIKNLAIIIRLLLHSLPLFQKGVFVAENAAIGQNIP
jgi:hypothetical protein